MKKKIFIIGLLSYLIFINGVCKMGYQNISLQNDFNDSIFVATMMGLRINYPDTTLPDEKPIIRCISPRTTRSISNLSPHKYIIDFFKALPHDTLSIYLFDNTTFNSITWIELKDEYKVLKRYDLSYDDCKKLNWTISYPPTEAMKDIKQYPPY